MKFCINSVVYNERKKREDQCYIIQTREMLGMILIHWNFFTCVSADHRDLNIVIVREPFKV